MSDTNNESIDTLINDDEDFLTMDFEKNELHMMSDTRKQCNNELLISTTSKFIPNKSYHLSRTTRNPYDDGFVIIYFVLFWNVSKANIGDIDEENVCLSIATCFSHQGRPPWTISVWFNI